MSGNRPRGGRGGGQGAGRGGGRGGGRGTGRGRGRGSEGPATTSLAQSSSSWSPQAEDSIVNSRDLVTVFKKLKVDDPYEVPMRPGFASAGKPIMVMANYFQLLPKPESILYMYSVAFRPEEKTKRKRTILFERLVDEVPDLKAISHGLAFDSTHILISAQKLPFSTQSDSAEYALKEEQSDQPPASSTSQQTTPPSRITLSFLRPLPMQELLNYVCGPEPAVLSGKEDFINALNIVLSRFPNKQPLIASSGSNTFFPFVANDPRAFALGQGLIALRGYFASVRTSFLRVLVNVNVAAGAFYRETTVDKLMREFGTRNHAALNSFLRLLKVRHRYMVQAKKRTTPSYKTIFRLAHTTPVTARFRHDTWGEISVQSYFQRQYGIRLTQLDLPCIDVGGSQRQVLLPPEICSVVPGQPYRKTLTPEQTGEMVKFAVKKPDVNRTAINGEGLNTLGFTTGQGHPLSGLLDPFGLQFNREMLQVPARHLPLPLLQYQGTNTVSGNQFRDRASWNLSGAKFIGPKQMPTWTVIFLRDNGKLPINSMYEDKDRRAQLINGFRGQLVSYMAARPNAVPPAVPPHGVVIDLEGNWRDPQNFPAWRAKLSASLPSIRDRAKSTFYFVVLPGRKRKADKPLYSYVKKVVDLELGVHCVCMLGIMFEQNKADVTANIALKVNLKMGGANHMLKDAHQGQAFIKGTMFLGMDVTHPSPGSQSKAPSVAAVVANSDDTLAQWPGDAACMFPDDKKQAKEIFDTQLLIELVRERVKFWLMKNANKLPQRIIVYRDGVSESMYKQVLEVELSCIKQAIAAESKGKLPPITFVTVGKRHHTRFYPRNPAEADPTGNTWHSTVVDRGITMERGWDFFLQAHSSPQGTSRPAHYVVLRDEIGFMPDQLEQLSHALCFMFGRATKGVSLCPPAYYADILAERGRMYLYDTFFATNDHGSESSFDRAAAGWDRFCHPNLRNTMFYI